MGQIGGATPRPRAVEPEPDDYAARIYEGRLYSSRESAQLAREIDERAKREAAERAAAEKQREKQVVEDRLRASYLAQPGATAADWERDKAAIIAEGRKTAVLQADAAAARVNKQRYS